MSVLKRKGPGSASAAPAGGSARGRSLARRNGSERRSSSAVCIWGWKASGSDGAVRPHERACSPLGCGSHGAEHALLHAM